MCVMVVILRTLKDMWAQRVIWEHIFWAERRFSLLPFKMFLQKQFDDVTDATYMFLYVQCAFI